MRRSPVSVAVFGLLIAVVLCLLGPVGAVTTKKPKTTPAISSKVPRQGEAVTPSDVVAYCPLLNPYRGLVPVSLYDKMVVSSLFSVNRIVEVADVDQTVSVRAVLSTSWNTKNCDSDASSLGLDDGKGLFLGTGNTADFWVPPILFQSSVSDVAMSGITKVLRINIGNSTTTSNSSSRGRPVQFTQRNFGLYQTEGQFQLASFPFDNQTLSFKFCFTMNKDKLAFSENETSFLVEKSSITDQWWIDQREQSVSFTTIPISEGQDEESYYDSSCVVFSQVIHRRPAFFIYNIMAPSVLLSSLNIVTFFITPTEIDRTNMNIGVLMAISVFVSVVVQYIPQTPQRVFLTVFTFLLAAFSALCTFQSAAIFWFIQVFPEKAEKRICCFSLVRLIDIVTFTALLAIPLYASIYTLRTASGSISN